MSDDGVEMAVDEFAEYCRTQAGLLAGSVEQMSEEADALLDEIDEGAAEVRARLDARNGAESAETTASPSAGGERPNAASDLDSIAELESELEQKQAVVEAKQARMKAFRALAEGYVELAHELRAEVDDDDGREAMERVVRFEADRDAPAYFDDRFTVCEAASGEYESGDDGGNESEGEGANADDAGERPGDTDAG